MNSRLVGAVAVTAVAFVGAWEGLRTIAYRDPVGIPTICFGATRGVKMGDVKSVAECERLLMDELVIHERGMRACLKDPDAIPDGAYTAFLSLTYNIGTGAFCRSTLAKMVNAGDVRSACDQLLRWNRAGGFALRGLTNRRVAEREMCLASLSK